MGKKRKLKIIYLVRFWQLLLVPKTASTLGVTSNSIQCLSVEARVKIFIDGSAAGVEEMDGL
jgi:hypothetical protein